MEDTDTDNDTPLSLVAEGRHAQIIEDHGCLQAYSTALHSAAHGDHLEAVQALVQAQADVCAQNKDGHTHL